MMWKREGTAMARRVTIQDIADELGLSRNTVSKALNNGDGLSEATRERVIRTAMEMGYRQFAFASSLLANTQKPLANNDEPIADLQANEIALLSTKFLGGSHFASLMLDAFQNEFAQLGYSLSMHRVSDENIAGVALPLTFRLEQVAAIICFEMFDRTYDEMLCELGKPILFVDMPPKADGITLPADKLIMDNTSGITQLVNRLLAAGKTRIGFLGNYLHCQSFFERYSAFRLAMLLAGQDVDERFIIPVNDKSILINRLWQLEELPDVFLCANDFIALDALETLRARGFEVPRDVWLTGFDDSTESRRSAPPLTTVHIHTQVMAYSAVQLLRTRMREPSLDYRCVYTETALTYRESTPFD